MNKRKSRKTTETKAARIRTLREQGYKPKEIAAFVGCDVQHVYTMNYLDKIRNLAKTSTAEHKAMAEHQRHVENLRKAQSVILGAPQGGFNLNEVKTEGASVPGSLQYLGNPRPNLWTRIKAVFTGRYE